MREYSEKAAIKKRYRLLGNVADREKKDDKKIMRKNFFIILFFIGVFGFSTFTYAQVVEVDLNSDPVAEHSPITEMDLSRNISDLVNPMMMLSETCTEVIYETDQTVSQSLLFAYTGGGNQKALHQKFQIPETAEVCGVQVSLKKYGAPTNNVIVGIRDAYNGSNLNNATINGGDITTDLENYGLDFDTPITLTANTDYWLDYRVDSGGNESNRYAAGESSTNNGYIAQFQNSNELWYDDGVAGLVFTLYGEGETPPTPTSTPISTSTIWTTTCQIQTIDGVEIENCYNPIYVQIFYMIDALFFGVVLYFSTKFIKKILPV